MTQQEIKFMLDHYDELHRHIRATIIKLQKVDPFEYSTGKGITRTTIGDGCAYVYYDMSSYGQWDEYTTSFPVEWLALSDEELIKEATADKQERDERKRSEKEEVERKEKERQEAKERELLETLKAKYEK